MIMNQLREWCYFVGAGYWLFILGLIPALQHDCSEQTVHAHLPRLHDVSK